MSTLLIAILSKTNRKVIISNYKLPVILFSTNEVQNHQEMKLHFIPMNRMTMIWLKNNFWIYTVCQMKKSSSVHIAWMNASKFRRVKVCVKLLNFIAPSIIVVCNTSYFLSLFLFEMKELLWDQNNLIIIEQR